MHNHDRLVPTFVELTVTLGHRFPSANPTATISGTGAPRDLRGGIGGLMADLVKAMGENAQTLLVVVLFAELELHQTAENHELDRMDGPAGRGWSRLVALV